MAAPSVADAFANAPNIPATSYLITVFQNTVNQINQTTQFSTAVQAHLADSVVRLAREVSDNLITAQY